PRGPPHGAPHREQRCRGPVGGRHDVALFGYLSSNTWIPAIIVADSGKFLIEPRPGGCGDAGSEAEFYQLFGIPLPVFGNLDMQIQVDPGSQERLDSLTRIGSDFPQPAATLTDDDGFSGRPPQRKDGPDVQQGIVLRTSFSGHDFLNDDGKGVGKFIPDTFEGGFADEFSNHDGLGLGGQLAIRVKGRRRRHVPDKYVGNGGYLETIGGRNGNDIRPALFSEDFTAQSSNCEQLFRQCLPVHQVSLSHNGNNGLAAPGSQLSGAVLIAGTDLLIGRPGEADGVHP